MLELANEGSRDEGNGLGGDDAANDNQATIELDEGFNAEKFDIYAAKNFLRLTAWEPKQVLTIHSQLPGSPFHINLNLDIWCLAIDSNTFQTRTIRPSACC